MQNENQMTIAEACQIFSINFSSIDHIGIKGLTKKYHKLALKFHPDKNQSENNEEAFKRIGNAFQILKKQCCKQIEIYIHDEDSNAELLLRSHTEDIDLKKRLNDETTNKTDIILTHFFSEHDPLKVKFVISCMLSDIQDSNQECVFDQGELRSKLEEYCQKMMFHPKHEHSIFNVFKSLRNSNDVRSTRKKLLDKIVSWDEQGQGIFMQLVEACPDIWPIAFGSLIDDPSILQKEHRGVVFKSIQELLQGQNEKRKNVCKKLLLSAVNDQIVYTDEFINILTGFNADALNKFCDFFSKVNADWSINKLHVFKTLSKHEHHLNASELLEVIDNADGLSFRDQLIFNTLFDAGPSNVKCFTPGFVEQYAKLPEGKKEVVLYALKHSRQISKYASDAFISRLIGQVSVSPNWYIGRFSQIYSKEYLYPGQGMIEYFTVLKYVEQLPQSEFVGNPSLSVMRAACEKCHNTSSDLSKTIVLMLNSKHLKRYLKDSLYLAVSNCIRLALVVTFFAACYLHFSILAQSFIQLTIANQQLYYLILKAIFVRLVMYELPLIKIVGFKRRSGMQNVFRVRSLLSELLHGCYYAEYQSIMDFLLNSAQYEKESGIAKTAFACVLLISFMAIFLPQNSFIAIIFYLHDFTRAISVSMGLGVYITNTYIINVLSALMFLAPTAPEHYAGFINCVSSFVVGSTNSIRAMHFYVKSNDKNDLESSMRSDDAPKSY